MASRGAHAVVAAGEDYARIHEDRTRAGDRMIARRRIMLAFGASLLLPLTTRAQPRKDPLRIGFLGIESAEGLARRIAALRAGLRERGYVEGRNLIIEFRWAEGRNPRLPALAEELVRIGVDVIVTHAAAGSLAAKQATTTVPIVVAVGGDLVRIGVVASLARPGGNITGSTYFQVELIEKRLQLIKEALPQARRVGLLLNPDNPINVAILEAIDKGSRALKVDIERIDARSTADVRGALTSSDKRIDAIVVHEDPRFISGAREIAEVALRARLASIGFTDFVEAGGLLSYGADLDDLYRRAAYFVDRIAKGAKPSDLPIERATHFDLVINLKTATALGITLPSAFSQRADRVIE